MSETKRTVDDVRNEYSQVCAKLGHLEYQVYVLKKDIDLVKKTLEDLNFEAASISAKEVNKSTTTLAAVPETTHESAESTSASAGA